MLDGVKLCTILYYNLINDQDEICTKTTIKKIRKIFLNVLKVS